MNKHELYQKAIDTWGIDAQRMVFHEEMGELLSILEGFTEGDLAEEIADAIIMTEQILFSYGTKPDIDLNEVMQQIKTGDLFKAIKNSYLGVNQSMSHFHRKRTTFEHLKADLSYLWAFISLLGIFHTDEPVAEIKKEKLERLASLLGVTYEDE